MLDKQEYNLKHETLPLSNQESQNNKAYMQKGRQGQPGRSRLPQKNGSKEASTWPEAMLMQNFAFMIEKLDGKKKASKQARRNVVDGGGKRFMELAEVFAKRLERAKRGKFTFLLVGRAGADRAQPVNALLGEDVVPRDEQVHDTLQVTIYEQKMANSKFSIIDTPGLCDIPADYMKDYIYITRLEDGAPRFDGMWFVTPLLEAGITDGERRAIDLITRAYGSDAWRYSLIVLTYSGVSKQEMTYQKIYQEKMECVRHEIARLVGEEIAADIPAVASAAKITSDDKGWLSELYLTVSMRMSDQGYLSFLLSTARRLKFSPLKKYRKAVQSIRISTSCTQQPSPSLEDQESCIYIDEEKGCKIERRMRDYLTNAMKRNSIPSL